MDVATAAFFVVVSLPEICLKSLENLFYQFEKLMIYLWSTCKKFQMIILPLFSDEEDVVEDVEAVGET